MPAAYDTYDYPSYWIGREYEHEAEVNAISCFLSKIKSVKKVLEIGAGYGRLAPYYSYRASKVILSDPSAKLLKIARKNIKDKKMSFIQSKIENLGSRLRKNAVDVVLIVRVLHHIDDIDKAFSVIKKVLKKDGYLILEFANKKHFKATICEFFKGNFTYPLEIFPKDRRSKKSIAQKTLPFKNYHPDQVKERLKRFGFEIIEIRSVSNIRSDFFKRILSQEILVKLEKLIQNQLSFLNFGPSIFILAKNKK